MEKPDVDTASVDEMIEEIRLGLELALQQQSALGEHVRLLDREMRRQRRELERLVRAHQRASMSRLRLERPELH